MIFFFDFEIFQKFWKYLNFFEFATVGIFGNFKIFLGSWYIIKIFGEKK